MSSSTLLPLHRLHTLHVAYLDNAIFIVSDMASTRAGLAFLRQMRHQRELPAFTYPAGALDLAPGAAPVNIPAGPAVKQVCW